VPSSATIAVPLAGTRRCNSAVVLAGDENAARILSADSGASAGTGLRIAAGRASDLSPGV